MVEDSSEMATSEHFLCGVVEGFYSRPWSENQRLDLYEKMDKYGLNTYVCTLTLKRAGGFLAVWGRGMGWKLSLRLYALVQPHFFAKSTKNGLK